MSWQWSAGIDMDTAYLLIDMQQGYVDPASPLHIAGAAATVPACRRTMSLAREKGMPVIWVRRAYSPDGSDIELTRHAGWQELGRPIGPDSTGWQWAEGLEPQEGDYCITKPRYSAFFATQLDLLLRRLGVRTVVLCGTTLPNCIRTTCYDALSLDYQVAVLTDCCSAQTEEIRRVNLKDMARVGAVLLTEAEWADFTALPDPLPEIRQSIDLWHGTHTT